MNFHSTGYKICTTDNPHYHINEVIKARIINEFFSEGHYSKMVYLLRWHVFMDIKFWHKVYIDWNDQVMAFSIFLSIIYYRCLGSLHRRFRRFKRTFILWSCSESSWKEILYCYWYAVKTLRSMTVKMIFKPNLRLQF